MYEYTVASALNFKKWKPRDPDMVFGQDIYMYSTVYKTQIYIVTSALLRHRLGF